MYRNIRDHIALRRRPGNLILVARNQVVRQLVLKIAPPGERLVVTHAINDPGRLREKGSDRARSTFEYPATRSIESPRS